VETNPPEPDTAGTAMAHWTAGAASGSWSDLLALLDSDVRFQVPTEGFAGVQRGIDAARRFFDHLGAFLRAELRVTSTLREGDRTVFEVAVEGNMSGRDFVQALCLVLVIRDDRVQEFREYLAWPGGLDPDRPPIARSESSPR
jgi:ketosteroid isomerase-like protein